MKRTVPLIIRWVTGVWLLILSIPSALHGHGPVRTLAVVEIAACAAFCVPGIWRIGGGALLAVLTVAFAQDALLGRFASALMFPAFVVILELFYGRQ